MKTVLFVCIDNSGRSQMAEAFFNPLAGEKVHTLLEEIDGWYASIWEKEEQMENARTQQGEHAIEIVYCVEWGYGELASSMGAAIERGFGVMVSLVEGHGGVFEVAIGRHTLFTNRGVCGGLPREEDIIGLIDKHLRGEPGLGDGLTATRPDTWCGPSRPSSCCG